MISNVNNENTVQLNKSTPQNLLDIESIKTLVELYTTQYGDINDILETPVDLLNTDFLIDKINKSSNKVNNKNFNEIKRELFKINLEEVFEVFENIKDSEEIYRKFKGIYETLGLDANSLKIAKDLESEINSQYLEASESFKSKKGTRAGFFFIYDIINKSGIENFVNDPYFKLTEDKVHPFTYKVESSLYKEIYEKTIVPLSHPVGFCWDFIRLISLNITDYFGLTKSITVQDAVMTCYPDKNYDKVTEVSLINEKRWGALKDFRSETDKDKEEELIFDFYSKDGNKNNGIRIKKFFNERICIYDRELEKQVTDEKTGKIGIKYLDIKSIELTNATDGIIELNKINRRLFDDSLEVIESFKFSEYTIMDNNFLDIRYKISEGDDVWITSHIPLTNKKISKNIKFFETIEIDRETIFKYSYDYDGRIIEDKSKSCRIEYKAIYTYKVETTDVTDYIRNIRPDQVGLSTDTNNIWIEPTELKHARNIGKDPYKGLYSNLDHTIQEIDYQEIDENWARTAKDNNFIIPSMREDIIASGLPVTVRKFKIDNAGNRDYTAKEAEVHSVNINLFKEEIEYKFKKYNNKLDNRTSYLENLYSVDRFGVKKELNSKDKIKNKEDYDGKNVYYDDGSVSRLFETVDNNLYLSDFEIGGVKIEFERNKLYDVTIGTTDICEIDQNVYFDLQKGSYQYNYLSKVFSGLVDADPVNLQTETYEDFETSETRHVSDIYETDFTIDKEIEFEDASRIYEAYYTNNENANDRNSDVNDDSNFIFSYIFEENDLEYYKKLWNTNSKWEIDYKHSSIEDFNFIVDKAIKIDFTKEDEDGKIKSVVDDSEHTFLEINTYGVMTDTFTYTQNNLIMGNDFILGGSCKYEDGKVKDAHIKEIPVSKDDMDIKSYYAPEKHLYIDGSFKDWTFGELIIGNDLTVGTDGTWLEVEAEPYRLFWNEWNETAFKSELEPFSFESLSQATDSFQEDEDGSNKSVKELSNKIENNMYVHQEDEVNTNIPLFYIGDFDINGKALYSRTSDGEKDVILGNYHDNYDDTFYSDIIWDFNIEEDYCYDTFKTLNLEDLEIGEFNYIDGLGHHEKVKADIYRATWNYRENTSDETKYEKLNFISNNNISDSFMEDEDGNSKMPEDKSNKFESNIHNIFEDEVNTNIPLFNIGDFDINGKALYSRTSDGEKDIIIGNYHDNYDDIINATIIWDFNIEEDYCYNTFITWSIEELSIGEFNYIDGLGHHEKVKADIYRATWNYKKNEYRENNYEKFIFTMTHDFTEKYHNANNEFFEELSEKFNDNLKTKMSENYDINEPLFDIGTFDIGAIGEYERGYEEVTIGYLLNMYDKSEDVISFNIINVDNQYNYNTFASWEIDKGNVHIGDEFVGGKGHREFVKAEVYRSIWEYSKIDKDYEKFETESVSISSFIKDKVEEIKETDAIKETIKENEEHYGEFVHKIKIGDDLEIGSIYFSENIGEDVPFQIGIETIYYEKCNTVSENINLNEKELISQNMFADRIISDNDDEVFIIGRDIIGSWLGQEFNIQADVYRIDWSKNPDNVANDTNEKFACGVYRYDDDEDKWVYLEDNNIDKA